MKRHSFSKSAAALLLAWLPFFVPLARAQSPESGRNQTQPQRTAAGGAGSSRIVTTEAADGDLQAALNRIVTFNNGANFLSGGGEIQFGDTIEITKPIEIRKPQTAIDGKEMPIRAQFLGTMVAAYPDQDVGSGIFAANSIVSTLNAKSLQFFGTHRNGQEIGEPTSYSDYLDLRQSITLDALDGANGFSFEGVYNVHQLSGYVDGDGADHNINTNLVTSYGELTANNPLFSAFSIYLDPARQVCASLTTATRAYGAVCSRARVALDETFNLEADYSNAVGQFSVYVNGERFVNFAATGALKMDQSEGIFLGAVAARFSPQGEPNQRAGNLRVGAVRIRGAALNNPRLITVPSSTARRPDNRGGDKYDDKILFVMNLDHGDDFGLFAHTDGRFNGQACWLFFKHERLGVLNNLTMKNIRFESPTAEGLRLQSVVGSDFQNLRFNSLSGGIRFEPGGCYYNAGRHIQLGGMARRIAEFWSHDSRFDDITLTQPGDGLKYGIFGTSSDWSHIAIAMNGTLLRPLIFRGGFGNHLSVTGGTISTEGTAYNLAGAMVTLENFNTFIFNGFSTPVDVNKNRTAFEFDSVRTGIINADNFGGAGVATGGATVNPAIKFLTAPASPVRLNAASFSQPSPLITAPRQAKYIIQD